MSRSSGRSGRSTDAMNFKSFPKSPVRPGASPNDKSSPAPVPTQPAARRGTDDAMTNAQIVAK